MTKQEALEALKAVKKSAVMPLKQAEPLFDALAACYNTGCTTKEINDVMYETTQAQPRRDTATIIFGGL